MEAQSDSVPGSSEQAILGHERMERLVSICSSFGVESIYAFGSRASRVAAWLRGEVASLGGDQRDVDIGIRSRRGLDVHDKVRLAISLEDHFGVARVDLVDLADVDPFVAANVVRGERLFEEDSHAGAEYELYVLRRAGDLIPLEEERSALILGRRS